MFDKRALKLATIQHKLPTRYAMHGLLFQSGRIAATDGTMVAILNTPTGVPDGESIVLDTSKVNKTLKTTKHSQMAIEYADGQANITAQTDASRGNPARYDTMPMTMLDGVYPPIDDVIPTTAPREEFDINIDTFLAMTWPHDSSCRVEMWPALNPRFVGYRCTSSEATEGTRDIHKETSLDAGQDKPKVNLGLDPVLVAKLLKLVKAYGHDNVTFEYRGPKSAVVFRAGDLMMLIMPINLL